MNKNRQLTKGEALINLWLKRSLVVVFCAASVIVTAVLLLRNRTPQEKVITRENIDAPAELNQASIAQPKVTFKQMAQEAGIDFTHTNGAEGRKFLPETMGSGIAIFDVDRDGHQDILFVDGTHWPNATAPKSGQMRLYRNHGQFHFEDVAQKVGLTSPIYGMGCALADVDNDGDQDLFLTAVGENRFYRNHNGQFRDETAATGLAGPKDAWSTSAGFFDADNDGDLDLFVCNYIQWSQELDLQLNFTLNGTDRAYGPPQQYPGTHNLIYRNDGDRFTEVSAAAGIQVLNPATGAPMGKSLAVTFVDLDNNGLLDILVANDTVQNFVFKNLGDFKFEEVGVNAGLAFDTMGSATGAMGMDAARYANDDRMAVSIANFANESTSFYVQHPSDPWFFADMTNSEGIGSPSRLKLSFGLFFFDYDLNGFQDLLQANGHLETEINEIQPSQHYRQPAQLFWNQGKQPTFIAVAEEEVGDLAQPIVGRGAAFGDLDGDGDLDVILTNNGGSPLVLRNDQASAHHWLRLELQGTKANRDAIGARVALKAGGRTQVQALMPTRSYLSQMERVLTFGLGQAGKVDDLTITWPDGSTQSVHVDKLDTTLTLVQP